MSLENVHVPNKKKLPIYGPLHIKDYREYLNEEAKKFLVCFWSPFPYQLSVDHFQLLYELGTGAFGVVVLVKYKLFGSNYAMKVLNKKELVIKDQVRRALNEKMMLQSMNCPFIVYLLYFSQDNSNIYFILPFISGGELHNRLAQLVKFSGNVARFYAAQVVLALEYLHVCNVIYRDLKPENIMLDHLGYIKVTDFGLSKMVQHRTYTFCGTPDYLAPEVILSHGHGKAVDWWTLGVLVFEMSCGRTPFCGKDDHATFENILSLRLEMPSEFGADLRHLVSNLLQSDVTKRLGNMKSGASGVKNHPWFHQIDWLALLNRRVAPPYMPGDVRAVNKIAFPDMKKISELKIAEQEEFEELFLDF